MTAAFFGGLLAWAILGWYLSSPPPDHSNRD